MAGSPLNDQQPPSPVLRLAPPAWEKLWLYIALCPTEVGGLGTVEQAADGNLTMGECFLLDQEATDVDTILGPEGLSRFLLDYLGKGRDPTELQVWWHSHAQEAVFWSGDDERTIERWPGDCLVALVGNQRGQFLARQEWYRPARGSVGWLEVQHPRERPALRGQLADAVRAELDEKVRRRPRGTNKLWTDAELPKRW